MGIIGLTHQQDGSPHISRTVNCKIAIGLAPEEGRNYPKKLDHFAFLKMEMVGKDMKWVVDTDKQDHFGADCKSFWIVLMGDEVDQIFRTQLAAFVKTRCWCKGDGETAMRREKVNGEYKGDFKIWDEPCANHGCPDFKEKEVNGKTIPAACKPSGDLYFILSDFPTLGTICRIHTSSYQSIRQIHSALIDLQSVTGGRLMGVRCKLFVMPAKSSYTQGGIDKTGTKYVLGLELAAKDMPELMSQMSNTALMFQGLQKQLKGAVLDVVEEDDERAGELAAEFYPSENAPDPSNGPAPAGAIQKRSQKASASEPAAQPSTEAPAEAPEPAQAGVRPFVGEPQGQVLPPSNDEGEPGCITKKQIKLLFAVGRSAGLGTDALRQVVHEVGGVEHSKFVPKEKMDAILLAVDPRCKFHTPSNRSQQSDVSDREEEAF